jgi:hypothetical protein
LVAERLFLINGLWVPGAELSGWSPRAYATQAECEERRAFAERECRAAALRVALDLLAGRTARHAAGGPWRDDLLRDLVWTAISMQGRPPAACTLRTIAG